MTSISEQIMEHAQTLPEGSPLLPKDFLHLGSRLAVYQAFSRLARQDRLRRIFQGVYMRTIETRFGRRGPGIDKAIATLSELWGRNYCSLRRFGGKCAQPYGPSTDAANLFNLWT